MLAADGYRSTPTTSDTSGALGHFFDQIYYPCLEGTVGRPFGLYACSNNDTGGAVRGGDGRHGPRWRRRRRSRWASPAPMVSTSLRASALRPASPEA
jgi:hypothetical protein